VFGRNLRNIGQCDIPSSFLFCRTFMMTTPTKAGSIKVAETDLETFAIDTREDLKRLNPAL